LVFAARWTSSCRRLADSRSDREPRSPSGLLFDKLIGCVSFMTPSRSAALLGRGSWWPMKVRPRPASQMAQAYGTRQIGSSTTALVSSKDDGPAVSEAPPTLFSKVGRSITDKIFVDSSRFRLISCTATGIRAGLTTTRSLDTSHSRGTRRVRPYQLGRARRMASGAPVTKKTPAVSFHRANPAGSELGHVMEGQKWGCPKKTFGRRGWRQSIWSNEKTGRTHVEESDGEPGRRYRVREQVIERSATS